MDISIIIVSWNTCNILRDCLNSIYAETDGTHFEVIIIDNASSDASVDMIRSEFPKVHLIANETNRGFAAANNQGIQAAKGKYILLLNSDTIILDSAITKATSFADNNPEAAVIGCKVLNPDRTLQPTCFMFPSICNMILSSSYLYKIFPKNRFLGRERMSWWKRDDSREVDVVTGCFMLVRHEAIEKVGLMDEQFFMYAEETDWCYRFKKAGWKILFTPDANIIHFGGQSSKKILEEMALQLRGSILQFMKKHRFRIEYKLACILIWLFFILRIPFWVAMFVIGGKNREYSRQRMRIYMKAAKKILTEGGESLCRESEKYK